MQKKQPTRAKKIGNATPKSWRMNEEQRLNYQALHILYYMVRKGIRFSNFLTGDLKLVEPVIQFLENKGLIKQTQAAAMAKKVLGIKVGEEEGTWAYEPTEQAESVIRQYEGRYSEFVRIYDVYAFVDLETGEFAFEYIKSEWLEADNENWQHFIGHERWVDCRIPVAVFKGVDPREIVFFSMVSTGQLALDPSDKTYSWAQKLFTDEMWEEMYQVLETAPRWEKWSANNITNIIEAGAQVLEEQQAFLDKYIAKQNRTIAWAEGEIGRQRNDEQRYQDEDDEGGYVVTRTEVTEYYSDPLWYVGPFYSPLCDPLFWYVVLD